MKPAALLCMVVALSLTGCGTVMTLSQNKNVRPELRRYVYGGVRTDYWVISVSGGVYGGQPVFKCLTVLDLPLSAAADTVCLPYTIPRAIYTERKIKQLEQAESTVPVKAAPGASSPVR